MDEGFVWFDLRAKDPERAARFYADLLGWKAEANDGMTMFVTGEGPCAGVSKQDDGETAWVPFVKVDDADGSTRKAVELGAVVLQEAVDGPAGRFSVVRDPGGAPVALWQARG